MRTLGVPFLAQALLLLVIGAGSVSCRAVSDEPPSHLLGRWVTTAPAYEGRYFEIRPKTLTIETKTGPTFVYPVMGFETERGKGAARTYSVHYLDRDPERTPMTLRLVSEDGVDGLKIANHGELWTRVANSGTRAAAR